MMGTLMRDVRYTFRMLAKAPGFTVIAILTLALGIGANTAIFTVVYAALLRPLPYAQPGRLITIAESRSKDSAGADEATRYWIPVSYPDFQDWSKQSKSFAALAGFNGDGFLYNGQGQPQLLDAAQASTNFFSTLGVKPFLGRDFVAGEDVPSGPKVALLTYGFWRTQFGGNPKIVGQTIRLDSNAVTIIGVLPRTFEFAPAGDAALWVPLHLNQDSATRRNLGWFHALGRLAPGESLAQANAEMTAIMKRLAAAYPQEDGDKRTTLIPLRERIVGNVQSLLWILFGAVGFVLLIACANVANLLLVRAAGRRREFAIRAALGAGRRRLVSQLLTESLMLAGAGSVLGFLGAQWGTPLLIAAIPQQLRDKMPFLADAHASGVVFAFLCGAAVVTGVLFGLAPALQVSREKVSDALKEETQTVAGGLRARLRDALVIAEIAVCLVLLVGAGLMVESLGALLHRNPGFSAQNLLTFGVYMPPGLYPKDVDLDRFEKEFTDRLKTLPGVVDVAAGRALPLSGGSGSIRFVIEGHSVVAGHEDECDINDATPEYFTALKIPLVKGRFFDDAADKLGAPGHLIVNQAFVDRYLRGENPIGKRLRFTFSPKNPFQDIVGVVGNVPDNLDGEMPPVVYAAFRNRPSNFIAYGVRTAQNPAAIVSGVRSALHEMNSQLPLYQPATMEQVVARSPSVFLRRYPSYLIGGFAALALILACVGLYGLISYSVSQRTRELGIRIALGAQERDVMRLVMGQGARLALTGVAVGIGAGLVLTQLMRSLLFGISAADPLTFAVVAILLSVVAIAACYIPARRAMRTDPIVALRYE
ncbi:MAG TPA: ABC transporter permease [Candidatus Acidoferrales bacterium]|nr:ABC transporter permease [Candidatus Acidoferrales bacterium]